MTFTPCAARPVWRMPRTPVRWTMPSSEMSTSAWCARTTSARGEAAALLGELDRLDALGAARGLAVLVDRRALAVAALGDDEQLLLVARDVHREDRVVLAADVHAAHAGGVAAHRARVVLVEADGEAGLARP